MRDLLEIIITTNEDPKPIQIQFEALYALREKITSMLLLWNTNSYYVNIPEKTFMINGGRRLQFTEFKDCELIYRRRNSIQLSATGEDIPPEHRVTLIMGLKEKSSDRLNALKISADGSSWEWTNRL